MILFNTTIKVDHDIQEEFLAWIKQEHFARCLAGGLVAEVNTFRLLGTDEEDGLTYSLQYHLPDKGTYENFMYVVDNNFKKELFDRFGTKQVSFSSVLQMV